MTKTELKKYAKLIAKMGVNVKKGQDVIITANVSDAYFVEILTEQLYKLKARYVKVDWTDDEITKLNYQYASVETLSEFPEYKAAEWQHKHDTLPCMIYLVSSSPDALKDVDQGKQMEVRKQLTPQIWKYRGEMEGKYQWCIAALPSVPWAKKMFPEDSDKVAFRKLSNAIAMCARLEDNPIKDWNEHQKELEEKCNKLSSLNIDTLHYTNSLGTDFTVGLIENWGFEGGKATTDKKRDFLPNIPTEECFTSPDKYRADGVVYASLPLSLMGKVVKDFGFRFKDGKVVEVLAKDEQTKEVLETLVHMDENGNRLGEVALVPYESPVNLSGYLFYNTLFDENAACHLALGRGFGKHELINESSLHTDFMIGTADLQIVAKTRDGKTVQIFKDGTWAI